MQMTVNYAMTLLDQFCVRRQNIIFPLQNITVIQDANGSQGSGQESMMQVATVPDITRHAFHATYVDHGLCIICLENVKNNYLVKLDTCVCKEPRYHQSCLSKWFATRPNNQVCVCPVCSL